MERQVTLSRRCFKTDKQNAKAMIEGFSKNGKKLHQAIYCDVADKPFPMLITLNRSATRFKLSEVGLSLHAEDYNIPLKYIALLDNQYFIKNEIQLWEKLCNNGLFDIWFPASPFIRFEESKKQSKYYRLFLLRLYEINEEFDNKEVVPVSDRIDHIKRNDLRVILKKPIVNDYEFKKIKELLENSVKEHQLPFNGFNNS